MQYDFRRVRFLSDNQQELEYSSRVPDKQMTKDSSTPIESQIVGYNEARDQYVVKLAGEMIYVYSGELFQLEKVSDG
jgi:hypothetical protein